VEGGKKETGKEERGSIGRRPPFPPTNFNRSQFRLHSNRASKIARCRSIGRSLSSVARIYYYPDRSSF